MSDVTPMVYGAVVPGDSVKSVFEQDGAHRLNDFVGTVMFGLTMTKVTLHGVTTGIAGETPYTAFAHVVPHRVNATGPSFRR